VVPRKKQIVGEGIIKKERLTYRRRMGGVMKIHWPGPNREGKEVPKDQHVKGK